MSIKTDIRKLELLEILDSHCVRLAALTLYDKPEEVAFGNRSDIMTCTVNYGDSRI